MVNAQTANALSAVEAARKIRDGTLSSVDLVKACLARIDETDGQLKAWTHLDAEHALSQAGEMDKCLDNFFDLLQAHWTFLDDMTQAAKDAGLGKEFSSKHFMRCFRYRLYKLRPSESSMQADVYKNRYTEIFVSLMENATEHGGAQLELPAEAVVAGGNGEEQVYGN